jgi:hypothetical protein
MTDVNDSAAVPSVPRVTEQTDQETAGFDQTVGAAAVKSVPEQMAATEIHTEIQPEITSAASGGGGGEKSASSEKDDSDTQGGPLGVS